MNLVNLFPMMRLRPTFAQANFSWLLDHMTYLKLKEKWLVMWPFDRTERMHKIITIFTKKGPEWKVVVRLWIFSAKPKSHIRVSFFLSLRKSVRISKSASANVGLWFRQIWSSGSKFSGLSPDRKRILQYSEIPSPSKLSWHSFTAMRTLSHV